MSGGGAPVEWMGALVTVGIGTLAGVIGAFAVKGSAHSERPAGDSIADVEERLAHCISQLRDLDEQQGRLTPDGYAAQKADFEARAAELLRSRDDLVRGGKKAAARKTAEANVSPAMRWLDARPQLRGALWGGGVVAVAAVLWGLVNAEQHPQAGGPMAATRPPMAGAGGAGGSQDAQEMETLMAAIQQDPNSVPSLFRMAHLLLKNQMLEEARTLNDRAVALDPNNLEGAVHAAVLRASAGEGEQAIKALDGVVQQDPKFAEAWFFKGMLSMQMGKQAEMRESFKQFVAVAPDGPQKQRIKAMLESQATP